MVGALFLAMAAVVFADVVHRVFSRSPGRLAALLESLLASFGVVSTTEALDVWVAPGLTLLLVQAICYAGVRTRARRPGEVMPGRLRSLGVSVGLAAVLVAVVQVFVRFMPEGLMWAPNLALALLLWVGLLGASMATYAGRHLALEMGEKLWPASARPGVRAVAQALAGFFSVLIVVLGVMSAVDHYQAWTTSPQAALLPSVNLPKWVVFAIVPYAFGMMALRFFGRMSGLLPPPPEAPLEGLPHEEPAS